MPLGMLLESPSLRLRCALRVGNFQDLLNYILCNSIDIANI